MIEEKPSGGEKWGGHLNSRSVVLNSNDEDRQSGSRDPSFVYEEPPPNPRRALPLLEIGREDRPSDFQEWQGASGRSEEHTSELQSRSDLVCRLLLEKKKIRRRNIRRRITIPLTLSNLKLLRRITRTENILHRNFTRRQVAIQNRFACNICISLSTFSVKVLNLLSRSRRKTNKRKSKHSAMLRNKETLFFF